ncbi:hypothetical protein ACN6LI_006389 [Streptomyces violaceoruber]
MTTADLDKARKAASDAAAKLAQLQAIAEEKAAHVAAEREQRSQEFDQRTLDTWRDENKQLHEKHSAAVERLTELLEAEPWFQAYVEVTAIECASDATIRSAGNASMRTHGRGVRDAFKPRSPGALLEVIGSVANKAVRRREAEFAESLEAKRQAYINGDA